ncbi:sigma-70 family RNA polymerase sigma factor [Ancylobacter polymorphus]|uniref:RNA polymerase sigma-70 factor (ECF subfamily) n=1 Tax=Ancylobacter polymorphus TaxID=223390 RepID=A0ABU0BII2_9HYPH|nr:sigma-70 family RNA polymerase sigma factor [Ancylobacter polymorphus]MDQ0305111.1 RNA polymerase sigma-70 factor (ECF subfamily) [Ancylobacter polymorphus]MPT22621.1 sigma-70 family RNA polymerase sigma factor [Starkeya sp.]
MSGRNERELADLLRAAIAGDARSYALFLDRVAGLVRAYARSKISHGGVDPEDVVQEVLLAIHLKRHTWLPEAPVLPWVYAIARFKLIDAFRRRGRRVEVELDDIAETVPQPEVETVSARDIGRALEGLAPGQRSVVAAISVEGRSVEETARTLDMTESAVRVALHRGLAAIARRFGRE